jgi:hypothetical protein
MSIELVSLVVDSSSEVFRNSAVPLELDECSFHMPGLLPD